MREKHPRRIPPRNRNGLKEFPKKGINNTVKGLELAGANRQFQPTAAAIKGRSVIVKADDVALPKAIRYLWVNSPDAVTLYSAAGLPAGPFRMESGNSIK